MAGILGKSLGPRGFDPARSLAYSFGSGSSSRFCVRVPFSPKAADTKASRAPLHIAVSEPSKHTPHPLRFCRIMCWQETNVAQNSASHAFWRRSRRMSRQFGACDGFSRLRPCQRAGAGQPASSPQTRSPPSPQALRPLRRLARSRKALLDAVRLQFPIELHRGKCSEIPRAVSNREQSTRTFSNWRSMVISTGSLG